MYKKRRVLPGSRRCDGGGGRSSLRGKRFVFLCSVGYHTHALTPSLGNIRYGCAFDRCVVLSAYTVHAHIGTFPVPRTDNTHTPPYRPCHVYALARRRVDGYICTSDKVGNGYTGNSEGRNKDKGWSWSVCASGTCSERATLSGDASMYRQKDRWRMTQNSPATM